MCVPPEMQGFKPFGIPKFHLEMVTLLFEEYESIKLLDYNGLTQEQAAEKMNVSRSTLTRIYENARRTIAKAFVEGKIIVIGGGNVKFETEWFRCKKCFRLIAGIENHIQCKNCLTYNSNELIKIS